METSYPTNKKRLLFIVPSMVGGGVERCLLNLIKLLDLSKYDIDILAIKSGGDLIDQIPDGIGYDFIWKKEWCVGKQRIKGSDWLFGWIFTSFSSKTLARIFIKKQYDVAIDYWGQEGLKLIHGLKNCKKIAFIHTDMNCEGLRHAYFPYKCHEQLRQAYENMDYIACVSKDCMKSMEDRFNFDRTDSFMQVKYNVNLYDCITSLGNEKLSDEYKTDKGSMLLCAIGRLTQIKGFDRLIRICGRLRDNGYKFKLLILGQGEEKERLEKLIVELNLYEYVQLQGFQQNPYKFIKSADLFVCSSYFEGFSTVVSEAVILGVPVVTTDCTGAKEILGESEFGIVAGKDDQSLYDAIEKMLTDKALYQRYCKAVIQRQSFFKTDCYLKEIEKMFE